MPSETPRVLFCTSEMFPLANTGGLGDVAAALPVALRELGADVRVIMPGYPSALATAVKQGEAVSIGSPGGLGETKIIPARTPDTDIQVLLVDCPALYDRAGGPYGDSHGEDWPDNARRFALFSRSAALIATETTRMSWTPDIVHANDWQTGLVPALLATRSGSRPATVFTIHNLSFLGLFPKETFPVLGLPASAFGVDGVEFFGKVSYMKAGIFYTDRITTVSRKYAQEIQTEAFGCGLEGLLAYRARDLTGILNGADYDRWDPSRDRHIAAQYSVASLDGKKTCKAALQREMGLNEEEQAFLLGSVSRLTSQKGLDLLMDALPSVLTPNTQLVMLGSGDPSMERGFVAATEKYPGRLAVRIGFDDALAHRIEAGSDTFVMPSRYEPCGLNQMYSLKYGTPPIVHRVGGLADTVEDGETGFTFDTPRASALTAAIKRAGWTFVKAKTWRDMQLRAMAKDFGWPRAAQEYLTVYESQLARRV